MSSSGPHPVADTADGLQEAGLLGILLDLRSQPMDVHVHRPGLPSEVVAPDVFQELVAAEDLALVTQQESEEMTRRLAREEGIFAGISSGGATAVALRISQELKNAVIVPIICDRGDRYLSTGVFPD